MALNCAYTLSAVLAALHLLMWSLKAALHFHILVLPAVHSGLGVKKGEQHHPLR